MTLCEVTTRWQALVDLAVTSRDNRTLVQLAEATWEDIELPERDGGK